MDTLSAIITFSNDSILTIQNLKPTDSFRIVDIINSFGLPTLLATIIGGFVAAFLGIWAEKRKVITNMRVNYLQSKIDKLNLALQSFKKDSRKAFNINTFPDMEWADVLMQLSNRASEIGDFSNDFLKNYEIYLDKSIIDLFNKIMDICNNLGWDRASIESQNQLNNFSDIQSLDFHLGRKYIDDLIQQYNEIEPLLKKQLERHLSGEL